MRHFDVLIIGAGQAAIPLSWALAEAGKTVAIAERKHLGGSCVNFGCTPTKAALASSNLAYDARRASEFGLHFAGVEVHFAAVLTRARGIKEESREGLEDDFKGKDNPKILRGHARLTGRVGEFYRVEVGSDEYSAEIIVLDTGSRTSFPNIPGLTETSTLHAGNWLDRPDLAKRLAMIGGGVIALEMGQFYQRMGSQVTVFESGPRILGREDEDISDEMMRLLKGEKIQFRLNSELKSVVRDGLGVWLDTGEGALQCFDEVFICAGRTPNTDDVGLDGVGVELDEKGMVKVDKKLHSTARNIYAVGDIRGGPQFTHTSWDDFRILKSQLLGDGARTTDRVVPYAVFTDPELGRVGMTEAEAREAGVKFKVGRFDMTHNSLARERRNRAGFVKVLIEEATNQVIGGAILARDAGEMIQLLATMMALKADYRLVRDSVVSHPTYMEAVQSAMDAVS